MKKSKIRLAAAAALFSLTAALAPAGAAATGYISPSASLNSAPVAESIELTTYRSVPVTDRFSCLDPEGDAVTYSIERPPKKGTVEIDGDQFTYTPAQGKKGSDSFTYAATDSLGNKSNAATVTVKIKKQSTTVTYSDMSDSPAAYAATALAENGVFVGEQVGGEYLFRPATPVTRGEFLVMCLKMSGTELLSGITRTGFYDDNLIPDWQKPYVTTALMDSIISGRALSDGRVVFSPNDSITFAEAAVMLNNTLGITDVSVDIQEPAAPAWAYQASLNLSSCDIISGVEAGVSSAAVTRADAAQMLSAAMTVMESRSQDSLLGWLSR